MSKRSTPAVTFPILMVVAIAVLCGGFLAAPAVAEIVFQENFDSLGGTDAQLEDNPGWLGDNSDPTWKSDIETVLSAGPDRVVNVKVRQSPKQGDMVYCDPSSTALNRPLNEADTFSLSFNVANLRDVAGYSRLGIGFYDSATGDQKFQVNLGGAGDDVGNWGVNDPTDSYTDYPPVIDGTTCNGYDPRSVLLEYLPSASPGVIPGAVRLTLYQLADLGGTVLATGYGANITNNNKNDNGSLMTFNVDSIYFAAARYGTSSSSSINSADFDDITWTLVPEPSTLAMVVSGLLLSLVGCAWRKWRNG